MTFWFSRKKWMNELNQNMINRLNKKWTKPIKMNQIKELT